MEEKYITVSEAAKLLGVTTAWIYKLIEKHNLTVHYRRGVKVCKESDILKLNEATKSKFRFVEK